MKIVKLRVDLRQPKGVRRDLLVNPDMGLNNFHKFIQAAMPWSDEHLHEFEAGGLTWGHSQYRQYDRDSKKCKVSDIIKAAKGGTFTYTYDFGANWVHVIKVVEELVAAPGEKFPALAASKGKCPIDH